VGGRGHRRIIGVEVEYRRRNRIQKTDGAGQVVQMSYDALNRVTAKTFPNGPSGVNEVGGGFTTPGGSALLCYYFLLKKLS
jgi:YD repeat-containing protein